MSTAFRFFRIGPLTALGAAAVLTLTVPNAEAGQRIRRPFPTPWETAFAGNVLTVEVQVDGETASLYRTANAAERRYFEAQRGEEYALRIRNHTGRRVAVLISVDGLNAVNGLRSWLASSEPMYVLDPWQVTVVRGWRTSLEHVREFVFVDEQRSYASRTGQENGDLGWIRVLAFEEQPRVSHFEPWRDQLREGAQPPDGEFQGKDERGDAPAPGKAQSAAPPTQESQRSAKEKSFPGTGWGDRRRDPVRETWFDPQPVACDHLVLRYEYARGLADLGIFHDRNRLRDRDRGEFGFAQPPRW